MINVNRTVVIEGILLNGFDSYFEEIYEKFIKINQKDTKTFSKEELQKLEYIKKNLSEFKKKI